ncbi:MAG: hypothetical protein GY845_18040 [Planctomycetes bacterium]|nr:hypothetical protein [Planctomycetota bacterium]
MHHPKKTVRITVMRVTLLYAMLACVFLAGCPSLRVAQIDLKPDSTTAERFTLQVRIEVVEEEPVVEEDGKLAGGRGVLGVWMPPGWKTAAARIRSPDETVFSDLAAIADAEGHFPPPFPYVPGSWFAFVSDCYHINQGTRTHNVEIDIQGNGSKTSVTLGVAAALFNEEGSNGPVPTGIRIDVAAGIAKVRPPPAAPPPVGLPVCESIEHRQSTGDNQGCSCSYPGGPHRRMGKERGRAFNFSILRVFSTLI